MESLSTWQITQSVLPMYGLILLGGFLRKTGTLRNEADGSLMKTMINCLYPCLILDKILASETVRDVTLVAWTLPVGFCIILIGLGLCKLGARLFRLPKGSVSNTFATTCGIQNYGFAAVPIVMALFPSDLLGVLFVHSLGVEIALWTFGIAVLQGKMPRDLKSLFSAPVIAVIIGLILVFTGIGEKVTTTDSMKPLFTMMSWLGASSFPMALILVGATLSDELKSCIPTLKVAVASICMRTLALPLVMLGILSVPPVPKDLKLILIVQAAMPSAVIPIILSKLYGGHPATAGQVVITTQAVGILTIPIWITLGLKWFVG